MTEEQEKTLSEVHECVVELRTELRARGGLRDRVERIEQDHAELKAEHKGLVSKGLAIIGTITFFAAFAGSKTGAAFLRFVLGT